MKNFTIKNEWDQSFELQGTEKEIAAYFGYDYDEELEGVEDIIYHANSTGNDTIYYVED